MMLSWRRNVKTAAAAKIINHEKHKISRKPTNQRNRASDWSATGSITADLKQLREAAAQTSGLP